MSEHRAGQDRIDAHLHVWDRSRSGYAWLKEERGALSADFGAEQASEELALAGIDGAILVQADDTEQESDYLVEVARSNTWVRGIVGWVPLDEPAAVAVQLEHRTREPLFSGVRQLIHDDPRDDVLGLRPVRESLSMIAAAGLTFDVPNAWPRHLEATTALARDIPELTVVLDHLGKPPRASSSEYAAWLRGFTDFAALPNTVAKVSGLRMPGAEYSVAALRPTWDHALELFGAERLMYGGDWPITVTDGGYGPTFAVLDELIAELPRDQQDQIMGGTAQRVYRLTPAR